MVNFRTGKPSATLEEIFDPEKGLKYRMWLIKNFYNCNHPEASKKIILEQIKTDVGKNVIQDTDFAGKSTDEEDEEIRETINRFKPQKESQAFLHTLFNLPEIHSSFLRNPSNMVRQIYRLNGVLPIITNKKYDTSSLVGLYRALKTLDVLVPNDFFDLDFILHFMPNEKFVTITFHELLTNSSRIKPVIWKKYTNLKAYINKLAEYTVQHRGLGDYEQYIGLVTVKDKSPLITSKLHNSGTLTNKGKGPKVMDAVKKYL